MSDPSVRWITIMNVSSSVNLARYLPDTVKIFDEIDLDEQNANGRYTYRVLAVVADEGNAGVSAANTIEELLAHGYDAKVYPTYAEAREAILA